MLFYLAFLSACAFTLQGYLLKYNPVSKVAVFKSTNPLFGALFSAIILNETAQLFHYTTLIALALVCGGILIINLLGEKRIFKKQPALNSGAPPVELQDCSDGVSGQHAEPNAEQNQENSDENATENIKPDDKQTDKKN